MTRVIGIYSGKGGVGKTTVTSLLAVNYIKYGKKVFILDFDLNTPSIHHIFNEFSSDMFQYKSTGQMYKDEIFYSNGMIKKYIKDAFDQIKEFEPDIVLVDFPPSIMESHLEFMNKIKLSGIVLVTQPTKLSEQNLKRTSHIFSKQGVPILGYVINDSTNTGITDINFDGYEKLFNLTLDTRFNDYNILDQSDYIDNKTLEYLLNVDNAEFLRDNDYIDPLILMYLSKDNGTVTEDVYLKYGYEERKKYLYNEDGELEETRGLRFKNIGTWDKVRENHMRVSGLGGFPIDKGLELTTTEKIESFLNAFVSGKPLFRVNGNNSSKRFWIGTILEGTLIYGESDGSYGLPSLQANGYRLFIHEVEPISEEEFMEFINDGWIKTRDGVYIPPMEVLEEIENTFGRSRTGLYYNWQADYIAGFKD